MTIAELKQKRAKLIADARAIIDRAEAEKRTLTDDDNTTVDRHLEEAGKLAADIARMERLQDEERRLAATTGIAVDADRRDAPTDTAEVRRFAETWEMTEDAARAEMQARHNLVHYWRTGEVRGLVAGTDTLGGYVTAPQTVVRQLLQAVDDQFFMRGAGWATQFNLGPAESLGVPSYDTDYAAWDWTDELNTGIAEDDAARFGKREMKPNPLSKLVKFSGKMARSSVIDIESFVRGRLAYKLGYTMEYNYLLGDGVNKPLGIFTASNFGISTGRDVSTDNAGTAVTVDGLKNAKYTLKAQYWPGAKWIFHRDCVKMIAKLKDGNGQYLWQSSIVANESDRLLGFPVAVSELCPNTFTTGLYVGILGDFSYYWIANSLAMTMQRLNELYAATNQIGLIGRYEGDGMPVLEGAFVRVKLG